MSTDRFNSTDELHEFVDAVGNKLEASGQSDAADVLTSLQDVPFATGSERLGELGQVVRRVKREFSIDSSITQDLASIMREVNRVWPSL